MSAVALGLLAALMWGFHDVCVRFVSQKTPLMAMLMTVSLAGLAFHLGVMVVQDGFTPLPRPVLGLSALAGVFFLMASLGLYAAFQRGPVRLVAPIIASYPILSVAWAVINGVPVSLWQWAAVVAIVLGVSIVAALSDEGEQAGAAKLPTIGFALLSAVGFACTFAMGQAAAAQSGELPTALVTRLVLIGLLFLGMLALRLPFWPGRKALPILLLMGVADGIALLCVVSAGHLPDAQFASVTSATFGMLTIFLAWVFLKEKMTPLQWLGVFVAFVGIGYLAL